MADQERPRAINRFEALWLTAAALDLASALRFIAHDERGDAMSARIGGLLGIGITILLVLAVSRQRIPIARIALTVWFMLGLSLIVGGTILLNRFFLTTGFSRIWLVAVAASAGLKLVALYFLWTSAASAWLAEED